MPKEPSKRTRFETGLRLLNRPIRHLRFKSVASWRNGTTKHYRAPEAPGRQSAAATRKLSPQRTRGVPTKRGKARRYTRTVVSARGGEVSSPRGSRCARRY